MWSECSRSAYAVQRKRTEVTAITAAINVWSECSRSAYAVQRKRTAVTAITATIKTRITKLTQMSQWVATGIFATTLQKYHLSTCRKFTVRDFKHPHQSGLYKNPWINMLSNSIVHRSTNFFFAFILAANKYRHQKDQ